MFIATTNEASQKTQDYMKEGFEQDRGGREGGRERKERDFNSGKRRKSTMEEK